MKTFKTAFIAAVFAMSAAAATGAKAMTVADINPAGARVASTVSRIDFVFGDEMLPGRVERLDRVDTEAANAAVRAYFDFDAVVSLGTLALAGAAFVAVGVSAGRRRKAERDAPPAATTGDWRERVLEGIERDLARFVRGLRRAA
jgi:hypothetical protein